MREWERMGKVHAHFSVVMCLCTSGTWMQCYSNGNGNGTSNVLAVAVGRGCECTCLCSTMDEVILNLTHSERICWRTLNPPHAACWMLNPACWIHALLSLSYSLFPLLFPSSASCFVNPSLSLSLSSCILVHPSLSTGWDLFSFLFSLPPSQCKSTE